MVRHRLGVQAVQLGRRVEDYGGRLAVGGGVLVQGEVGQKGQVGGEIVGHFGNLVAHLAVWRRPEIKTNFSFFTFSYLLSIYSLRLKCTTHLSLISRKKKHTYLKLSYDTEGGGIIALKMLN